MTNIKDAKYRVSTIKHDKYKRREVTRLYKKNLPNIKDAKYRVSTIKRAKYKRREVSRLYNKTCQIQKTRSIASLQ